VSLSDDVGDPFRPYLRGMLATRRQFAVISGMVGFRLAVAGQRDLAAQHHDTHIEVMRVEILAEPTLLAAVDDFEALGAPVALAAPARQRPAVAPGAGDIGHTLGADVLGVHAAGGSLAALPGAERFRVVVAGDRDLTAEDEQSGVEVVAVVGRSHVRR